MSKRKLTIAAVAALAAALAVGVSVPASAAMDKPAPNVVSPNIVGGHAPSQQYSGMASLQANRNNDPNWPVCGAVLVSGRWAVTNAQCVTDLGSPVAQDPALFHLRIGSPDRTSGGVVVQVSKILIDPTWDWAMEPGPVGDFAMLYLSSYVQVQPFEVANKVRNSAAVRQLGWGLTEPDGEGPAPINLRELDLWVLPASACADAGIGPDEICLNNPHHTDGACDGDAGGPALQQVPSTARWAAIGGISRAAEEFCGTAPVVATNWTYYRPLMYQVMATGTMPAPSTKTGTPRRPDTTRTTTATTNTVHWAGTH